MKRAVPPPPLPAESRLVRPTVAAGALAGMLCSTRLWLSSHRLFPVTPVWRGLPQPPFPLDALLFGAALILLAVIAVARRPVPFLKAFLILLALLAALDQSRCQPWMLQYAVMFGALLISPLERALHACRLFLVCTYFYSGFQKLGYGFVIVLAGMVEPMFRKLHLSPAWLLPRTLRPVALLLAVAECLSGLLLLFPKARRPAVVCLILMHLSLLVWLGPLALGWNYVVWPWNLANIALLTCLFWREAKWNLRSAWRSHLYAKAVGTAFAILPILTMLSLWDSYLGFSLYSGNIKEAAVYVGPQRLPDLPAGVRPYANPDGVIEIGRWSEGELGVPSYPETRVYASVGRQVVLWLGSGAVVRVIQLGKPDPFTGQRQATSFDPLTY